TWAATTLVSKEVDALATGAAGRALAGTEGDGIFRSIDSGGTWTQSKTGLNNHSLSGIALDPSNPAIMYPGTDGGLYETPDGGATGTVAGSSFFDGGGGPVVIDPGTPSTVYAVGGGGVVKSVDAGATWTFCPGSNQPIHNLVIDPAAPSHLF